MRLFLPAFAALLLAPALVPAPLDAGLAASPTQAADSTLAIENVTVMTMTDAGTRAGQTVVVREGRIEAMGPAGQVAIPAGAVRIDGSGRYLMPGLAEMHAHVPPGNPPEQLVNDILFLYLANGITTIRGMLGAPYQLELRDRIERGETLGPRFYVGAPSINGNSAPDPETGTALVRQHAEAGYDFLKLHPGLSVATYDAVMATAREEGITTGGHVSIAVGLQRSLNAGQGTIDHMDGYLEESLPEPLRLRVRSPTDQVSLAEAWGGARTSELPRLARATRDAGVWIVPTAKLWESLYGPVDPQEAAEWPEMRYAPASMVQGWIQQKQGIQQQLANAGIGSEDIGVYLDFRRALLRTLAEEDVGLLIGTDSPQLFSVPGFSLHREIEYMAEHGVTARQILEAGTVNVATYVRDVLGQAADFGTVAPGQVADLVLLDGNPLEDLDHLRSPAGVVAGGHWLSRSAIEAELEAIAGRNPTR